MSAIPTGRERRSPSAYAASETNAHASKLSSRAAGFLLRREPAKAAVATLYGSASAVLVGEIFADALLDETDFADAMADWLGWPGWMIGAVLAYLIAAKGLPQGEAGAVKPSVLPVIVAALAAAVLACTQIIASKAFGMTEWEKYHQWDGPGWYRDLTRAAWYSVASVMLASVIAGRVPGGRGRFVMLPLAAWLGCAVTAGPVQYVQALGTDGDPPAVALMACLAGGGIGAAAGASALRHAATGLGLVSFILLFTAGEVTDSRLEHFPQELGLIGSMVLTAAVASWTARRDASLGSGVVAGIGGPLLIWSVYLTIGSRHYDHASQSGPYWLAQFTTLMALIIALAGLARIGLPSRKPCTTA